MGLSGIPSGFQCLTCGQWHDHMPLDLSVAAPSAWEDNMPGRLPTSLLTDDWCVIAYEDGHVDRFVRGILAIPVPGLDAEFRWGTWSSLSDKSFSRFRALWDADDAAQLAEPSWFGWHACRLPYPVSTLNIELDVRPQPGRQRPRFSVKTGDHPIAREQREGITVDRLAEILSAGQHSSPMDDRRQ